jgi:IS605 OrfB family transposase
MVDRGVDRTIKLALRPSPEQQRALHETARQFTRAFNAVCAHGYAQGEKNGVRLHHATYRASKERAPGLVSDLHIQARVKATEAVKSALARQKKGRPVSCPHSEACAPRYNVHTYSVDWVAHTVNLATTRGRQRIGFAVPAYAARYVGCPTASADLVYKRQQWFLHVVVRVPAPDVSTTEAIVGVDLGVTRAAVTSDNRFHGERRWRDLEARDFRLRRKLQKKGTKSAKRHLRKLSGRTARRRRDHDHVVSRRIVAGCAAGSTLAVENLTNIRTRVRAQKANGGQRRLHSWSFATLRAFLTYKAQERGIRVEGVDPRHTSQTCSRCGYKSRYNRRSQSDFHCRSCGYRTNADRNGARNVAAKLLANRGMSAAGGPSSTGLSCPPASSGEAQAVCFT